MLQKIKTFIILGSFILLTTLPLDASAQLGGAVNVVNRPFGGYVLFSTPCTCTPGVVYVQYSYMHPIQYPFFSHGLLLTPATFRYQYSPFLVLPPPTAWHLGRFTPAPSTPCLVGIPPACAPAFFADGIIFDTGSSFPGHPFPI